MRTLLRITTAEVLGATLLCLMAAATPGQAQVLAQRNWAGSGVTVEPWWRRAVFYRIDPATFQDSDGDGKGDLAGVAQRLDYLQALGVDALILDPVGDPGTETRPDVEPEPNTAKFDDLTREAVGHHLRVIVALGAPDSQAMASDQQYLALARSWLNQGAAGLYVPTRALQKIDGTGHIAILLHQLRLLTNGFPGGRVLIAGAPATADAELARALLREAQLTASAAISTNELASAGTSTAAALRSQLAAALAGPPGASPENVRGSATAGNPLLLAARMTSEKDADALQRTEAAMLLASRSAVILEAGQELGLATTDAKAPRMQWTPTNRTLKPAAPQPKTNQAAAVPRPAYEGFHPFVPPPRKDLLPAPKMPVIVESDDPQPAVVDPNSLPGFTAGELDAALTASNAATANVALEQADAKSLLNLYRQLIQLHHDNATVRNGTETLLDHDAEDALVWIRHAPAGVRTSASVVVVCRLGAPVADAGTKVTRSLVGASGDVVFVGEGR